MASSLASRSRRRIEVGSGIRSTALEKPLPSWRLALSLLFLLLAPLFSWSRAHSLGRQWRIDAGLNPDNCPRHRGRWGIKKTPAGAQRRGTDRSPSPSGALLGRRPGRRLLLDIALDLDLVVHVESEHSAGDRLQHRFFNPAVHHAGEGDVAVIRDDADGRVGERGVALEDPVAIDPPIELEAQPIVEA